MVDPETGELLAEQAAYYDALAPAYLEGTLDLPGADEVVRALDEFAPTGDVLELACGPGTWTGRLLHHADTLTAVDGSPRMLALARHHLGDAAARVRFVHADLFTWRPDRRYDAVVFGFWLSHVPLERFGDFWALVDDALQPGGRVFFADDGYRTPDEPLHGEASSTIRRRLPDGRAYRAVKVPHTPRGLEARLRHLGWAIAVTPTAGPFFWGIGRRAHDDLHGDDLHGDDPDSDDPDSDDLEEQLRSVLVGGLRPKVVELREYDPRWPAHFEHHRAALHDALGSRAAFVEHIGSTAVPGLAAKPIIDVLVGVDDPDDEGAYLPDLLDAGYELRVREPGHRALRNDVGPSPAIVHLCSPTSDQVTRYRLLRDHLRTHSDARAEYETTKRSLAGREWPDVNVYAAAKDPTIRAILRAAGWAPPSGRQV